MVDQLADVQRAPQRRLRVEQTSLNRVSDALSGLVAEFEGLLAKAKALKEERLYNTRVATVTGSDVAAASASAKAAPGNFAFNLTQLATAAAQQGGADVGEGIDGSKDITSASAGFAVAVTAGRFTVNGQQIDLQSGDSLNDVLARIASQTGLAATYDPATDKLSLTDEGGAAIVLGSAADTSNFLQAARLTQNGTDSVTSNRPLGGLSTSATLASARFSTSVTSGTFAINGVNFTVDTGVDTVADVLNRINQSGAGVVSSYDSVNDRFVLTNKVTGDIGISLAEGTSNFLTAARLTSSAGGVFVNGQDAQFTVNGGSLLTSRTNSLTAESHGIDGLTVTALATGNTTVSITGDSAPLKEAITDFIDQFNKVQKLIAIQTASSTDAKGTVSAGLLAGDPQAAESTRELRRLLTSETSGISSAIRRLESLGYSTDGYSNEVSLENSGALDAALSNAIDSIRTLFADPTNGIATRVGNYLERLVGLDGSFLRHREAIGKRAANIDEQVGQLEKVVLASRAALFEKFRAMEKTMAQINRQAEFFTARFGIT